MLGRWPCWLKLREVWHSTSTIVIPLLIAFCRAVYTAESTDEGPYSPFNDSVAGGGELDLITLITQGFAEFGTSRWSCGALFESTLVSFIDTTRSPIVIPRHALRVTNSPVSKLISGCRGNLYWNVLKRLETPPPSSVDISSLPHSQVSIAESWLSVLSRLLLDDETFPLVPERWGWSSRSSLRILFFASLVASCS